MLPDKVGVDLELVRSKEDLKTEPDTGVEQSPVVVRSNNAEVLVIDEVCHAASDQTKPFSVFTPIRRPANPGDAAENVHEQTGIRHCLNAELKKNAHFRIAPVPVKIKAIVNIQKTRGKHKVTLRRHRAGIGGRVKPGTSRM